MPTRTKSLPLHRYDWRHINNACRSQLRKRGIRRNYDLLQDALYHVVVALSRKSHDPLPLVIWRAVGDAVRGRSRNADLPLTDPANYIDATNPADAYRRLRINELRQFGFEHIPSPEIIMSDCPDDADPQHDLRVTPDTIQRQQRHARLAAQARPAARRPGEYRPYVRLFYCRANTSRITTPVDSRNYRIPVAPDRRYGSRMVAPGPIETGTSYATGACTDLRALADRLPTLADVLSTAFDDELWDNRRPVVGHVIHSPDYSSISV